MNREKFIEKYREKVNSEVTTERGLDSLQTYLEYRVRKFTDKARNCDAKKGRPGFSAVEEIRPMTKEEQKDIDRKAIRNVLGATTASVLLIHSAVQGEIENCPCILAGLMAGPLTYMVEGIKFQNKQTNSFGFKYNQKRAEKEQLKLDIVSSILQEKYPTEVLDFSIYDNMEFEYNPKPSDFSESTSTHFVYDPNSWDFGTKSSAGKVSIDCETELGE